MFTQIHVNLKAYMTYSMLLTAVIKLKDFARSYAVLYEETFVMPLKLCKTETFVHRPLIHRVN